MSHDRWGRRSYGGWTERGAAVWRGAGEETGLQRGGHNMVTWLGGSRVWQKRFLAASKKETKSRNQSRSMQEWLPNAASVSFPLPLLSSPLLRTFGLRMC